MAERHFIVATAGHVDHGKSSLVKALTSIDPDRLPEEKARGITIDLGFAHLELGHEGATYSLGIVDVPGHEDFVKNMVAGVGSIDLALLIVAADDGWMPQTEEHLQILLYLGVTRAVVALTKSDLCADIPAATRAIREQLAGTPMAEAPIIPTSISDSRGFEELKTALASELSQAPPARDIAKPRLPVDRVFTLRGFGTVVTGTLTGGSLQRGQSVILQPAAKPARLRSLQNHNREVESVQPGQRVALNLPDIANAEASGGEGVRRGDIVTLDSLGQAGVTMDVQLHRSSRLADGPARVSRPLKDGTRVRVHAGSANYPARVFLLETNSLLPGQSVFAQIRFEQPQFLFAGDRFILRDWPEQTTLAGGLVLDHTSNRRGFRSTARKALLTARASQPGDALAWVLSQLDRDLFSRSEDLLRQSRFSAAEIQQALAALATSKQVMVIGDRAIAGTYWTRLSAVATQAVDAFHRAHPERPGLPLNDLRAVLGKQLVVEAAFDPLIKQLCASGFTQVGTTLKRSSHRPSLPPQLQTAGAKLRSTLTAKPFEPPSRKELAPDAPSQQALRFLIETGEVVDLSAEIVMTSEAYQQVTGIIREHLRKQGKATVSELRQAIGTSRRILMPLLERLDKQGVTLRQGDWRVPGRAA